MTRIAIVGGGRAATLHAEAALATPGVDLVGVGGRPGTAGPLAAAMGVPDLALDDLVDRADGLVIAVSADATDAVVSSLPADVPVLVESPVRLAEPRARAMTAANLLHAPLVKQGLRAVGDLGDAHHLLLRGRAVRRDGARVIFSDPFAGAWPVLLMAAGAAATSVTATASADRAVTTVELSDGREVRAELEWVTTATASAVTELEVAGGSGVVTIGLWPLPTLEVDGRATGPTTDPALVALGFTEQMRRFAAWCERGGEPWPPISVGMGVSRLTDAAQQSAADDGAAVSLTL